MRYRFPTVLAALPWLATAQLPQEPATTAREPETCSGSSESAATRGTSWLVLKQGLTSSRVLVADDEEDREGGSNSKAAIPTPPPAVDKRSLISKGVGELAPAFDIDHDPAAALQESTEEAVQAERRFNLQPVG